MKMLTIFYDPHCGLCRNFKDWILDQAAYVYLNFVPYNGPEAEKLCPGIKKMNADQEIVVLADDGRLWQGPPAWVVCLWALRKYRVLSFHMATPLFLPVVQKACHMISQNRLKLSALLKLKAEQQLVQTVNEATVNCEDGSCAIPALQQAKALASKAPEQNIAAEQRARWTS